MTLVASTVISMDTTTARTTLVVIFGGQSAEHDVSCVTATHILQAADRTKYDITALAISRDGAWVIPSIAQTGEPLRAIGPTASPATITTLGSPDTAIVVMPLIHGPLGEDGTLQGLLEMINVPYVGSGVLASAIAMDKGVTKSMFAHAGIAQVKYHVLREDQISPDALKKVADSLGFPIFVKPANMGSSVGVTKAHNATELSNGVLLASQYDQWIICEEAVTAREIEVSVIGNRSPRASVAGEITPGNEFYDYADKYITDSASLMIPAGLTDAQSDEVRTLALKAYESLHCEGMARVDFFFEEHGRGFLCNEINTIPGFTPISMYPKLWQASGLSYSDLIDELVLHALEREGRKKRNTTL